MNLYENEYFYLTSEDDKAYILVKEVGYDIRSFHKALEENSRISVNNFLSLKRALDEVSGKSVEIGILKPEVEIFISANNMECEIKVNLNQDYIDNNTEEVRNKIIEVLKVANIKKGIEKKALMGQIIACEKTLIAKGMTSVEGEDASVEYFVRSDKKIKIMGDDKADYYNLDLIDSVKKGAWLGEKFPAKIGKEGFTIKGEILPAIKGRDEPLLYDDKSIRACEDNGKLVLRSLTDGAVSFQNNKISVQGHLIVDDVDFATGNIDFDGHVTINGTVKDGFSVSAVHDISVLGEIGMGSAEKVISKRGNIFIKGGVNGQGITEIEAERNVYTKYANEATITAGEEINIGYYAIGCDLYADKVLISGMNGRLISGSVYVKSQVVAGVIGNVTERETNINVHGFNRFELRADYEDTLLQYKELLQTSKKIKSDLNIYKNNDSSDDQNDKYYEQLADYEKILEDLSHLNRTRIKIQEILSSKGEGEVSVLTGMHPKTHLELKNMKKHIDTFTKGSFYIENNEIHLDED